MSCPVLGRVVLRRIAVRRSSAAFLVPIGVPWSRGLWGEFLPERRQRVEPAPPGVPERRR